MERSYSHALIVNSQMILFSLFSLRSKRDKWRFYHVNCKKKAIGSCGILNMIRQCQRPGLLFLFSLSALRTILCLCSDPLRVGLLSIRTKYANFCKIPPRELPRLSFGKNRLFHPHFRGVQSNFEATTWQRF